MEAEEANEASEGDEASDDDEVIGEAAGSQEDGDPHSTAAVRILMLEQDKRRLTAALRRSLTIRDGAARVRERRCDHFMRRMEEAQREVANWRMWWHHCCHDCRTCACDADNPYS